MRTGLIAILAGVALLLLSLFADDLGVGGEPGFGWKQGIGVGVGGGLILIGALIEFNRRRSPAVRPGAAEPPRPPEPPSQRPPGP